MSAWLATARAVDLSGRARGAVVRSEHDVRVEHGEQRPEVAAPRGGEESVNDLPLAGEVFEEAARHYDEPALAALIIEIAQINVWNRLNVTVRQPAGSGPG